MSVAELAIHVAPRAHRRAGRDQRFVDGLVACVLLAAMAICFSYYRQMSAQLAAARVTHAQTAAQLEVMEVENLRLANEVRDLRSNPEVIEQAARRELGMIRAGEIVLAIKPSTTR
jgi:cell division protein FtsB